ncbi:ribosomal-processing cysteine protease Prp [Eubacteriales bacterium mix99]|jgi:hypothetical protein|nr:ribosomal-processing cysteine protease Prp [Clostridiales bacterium]
MIRVFVQYGQDGLIREFAVKGHAGHGEAGRDIVCAAVSAVAQTAVIGLTDVVGICPKMVQKDGLLHCILPDGMSEREQAMAGTVLRTMFAGLKSIKCGYPNLLSIVEREVD